MQDQNGFLQRVRGNIDEIGKKYGIRKLFEQVLNNWSVSFAMWDFEWLLRGKL